MSNVEAAASLFGTLDSSVDPFDSIGNDENGLQGTQHALSPSNDNAASQSNALHTAYSAERGQLLDLSYTIEEQPNPSFSAQTNDYLTTEVNSYHSVNGGLTHEHNYDDRWQVYESDYQSTDYQRAATSGEASQNFSSDSNYPSAYGVDNNSYPMYHDGSLSTMGSTGQRGQSYETEGSRQYGEYNSQVYQSTYDPSKCSNTNLYETYAVNPPSREKSLDVPRVNSQVLLEGRASTSNHRPASYSAYDPPVPSSKSSRVRRIQEGPAMSSNTSYSLSSTDSRDHVGHFAEGDRRSADQNASWTYGESYGGNNHHGNIHRSFTASNVGNDVVQVEQYSEEPGELIQASNAYQSAPSQESNTQPQLMSSYLTSDDTHGGTLHRVTNEGMTFTNQRDRQDFYSTTPYGQSRRNLGGNVVSKSPEMFENGLRSNDETDESYFEQQRGSISHNSHPYVTIQHSSTSTRSRRLSEDSSSLAASIPLPISPNIIPKSHFTLSNGDMPSQHFGHSSQNIQNYNVEFSMAEHASDGQLIFHPQSEETLRVGLPLASDTRPILNAPPDTFLEEMLSDDIYSSNSRQDFTDSFEPQLLYSGTQDQYAGDSSKNHFSLHPPPARNGASSRQYLLPDSTSYSYIDTNASQSNTRVDEQFVSHSNTFRPEKNYDINGLSASFEKMDVAGHPSASPPMSLKSDRFSNTTSLHDPYAPAHLYPPTETFVYDHRPLPSNEDGTGFIEVSDIPSMSHNTYAPSPSLLGSNDPLERTRYKVPVVSFGFGGKLVTCFHNPPVTGTGFDIALSERRSTVIQVYPLRRLVSFSSDDSENFFPGPLLGDQGLSAASIVRAGLNNTVKTKKARVLTYLERRIGDASRDLGYLPQGSPSRQQAADKLTMMRLLKVMLDNDGQVSGSPQIDAAVREVLLGISKENFASSHYASEPIRGLGSYQTLPHRDETPVATYQVWSSVLEKLQDLLLQGEKRQAYRYALEEKLWAHAMIISSSLDKDSFQSVVNEFIASELGLQNGKTQTILSHDGVGAVLENSSAVNGRESLRVAYSLFSGQGSSSVQELLAPKHTLRALEIRPTKSGSAFPLVPEIPTSTLSERIPFNVLSKWNETAAIIYSGQMGMDSSLALTALGDHLTNSDWVYAAHCCYLLSPRSSPFGGISVPSARITLLGYQTHQWMPLFWRDSEFIIWSEIAEFALSLHTPAKGQESFLGFPHLLVYRLLWAERLAEYGDLAAAKRYCECIHATLNRATPYNCPSLVENLKELSDRITGESTSEKGSSWITGRIAKPNLDSIGDWLGKGLSRFVAGEGDPSLFPGNEETVNSDGNFSGAFSQFSTISSTENSIVPSPASSLLNVNVQSVLLDQKIPPVLSPLEVQKHSGRAVSAMDYYRPSIRQASPGPRVASASAATTKFGPEALHNEYSASSSNAAGNIDASIENTTTNGGLNDNEELGSVKRSNSWWGSTAEVADSTGTTPVAATFYRFEAPASQSAGFISLMDSNQLQPSVISPSANISISKIPEEEGDDDLGLGNDSTKKKPIERADQRAVEANKEEPAPPPSNVRNSGSWLGRWWSRDSSTPKPIKASLGEETSFYYDKELKKWVNKKAGVESQPETPPPPPPPARAQTASPSRNATRVSSNSPGTGLPPPPVRPASVAEVGLSLPRKQEDRKRSNLVPPEVNTSLSHDAGHALSGHSKPSGSKRNLRSRYVDVFQQ